MAKDVFRGPLEKIDECCYRIPKSYKPGMRVDGLIFADEKLLGQIKLDHCLAICTACYRSLDLLRRSLKRCRYLRFRDGISHLVMNPHME